MMKNKRMNIKLFFKIKFFTEIISLYHEVFNYTHHLIARKVLFSNHPNSLVVVAFAIGFPISNKTSAGFVQKLTTIGALETPRMPFQIGGDPQYELVLNWETASHA